MTAKRLPRWLWPVVVFVVFMTGIGALVADLSSEDQAIERQATRAANQYAADAEEQIRNRCLPLLAKDQTDCVRQADQAARENERVEFDLAAQQTTAWWTKVMGIAALIGMGLSAVGVLLVWTTFHETRQANLIAQRAHTAETRPILVFDRVEFYGTPAERTWDYTIVFRNIGKSPAYITGGEHRKRIEFADGNVMDHPEPVDTSQEIVVRPDDTFELKPRRVHADDLAAGGKALVTGHVQYSSILTDEEGNRGRSYETISDARIYPVVYQNGGSWTLEGGTVDPQHVHGITYGAVRKAVKMT